MSVLEWFTWAILLTPILVVFVYLITRAAGAAWYKSKTAHFSRIMQMTKEDDVKPERGLDQWH